MFSFNGPHGAFGKAPAGFGVMAKINRVVGRIEYDFVHSYHVALAERRNFYLDP